MENKILAQSKLEALLLFFCYYYSLSNILSGISYRCEQDILYQGKKVISILAFQELQFLILQQFQPTAFDLLMILSPCRERERERLPAGIVKRVGWGGGRRKTQAVANLLRQHKVRQESKASALLPHTFNATDAQSEPTLMIALFCFYLLFLPRRGCFSPLLIMRKRQSPH